MRYHRQNSGKIPFLNIIYFAIYYLNLKSNMNNNIISKSSELGQIRVQKPDPKISKIIPSLGIMPLYDFYNIRQTRQL